MSEQNNHSWEKDNLINLVSFIIGGDWGKDINNQSEPKLIKTRVIRGTDFKYWSKTKAQNAAIRYLKESSLKKRKLTKGDLILEVSGGGPSQPVGRTVIIDQEMLDDSKEPLTCTNFFRLLRCNTNINPKFLNYFLCFSYRNGDFNKFQTQTTNLRNLNVPDFLDKTLVPLPPTDEQKRIVEKLDQLLTKVQECQDLLAKIPIRLKRFRQSVLAAACSGKLTEEWRKQLKFESSWEVTTLNSLVLQSSNGISKRNSNDGNKVTVLRLADFSKGKRTFGDERYIRLTDSEIKKYKLENENILIIRVNGSWQIAGRFFIYENASHSIETYCDHFIRLKIDSTKTIPSFVEKYANSLAGRNFIEENLVTSAGQNTISQKNLLNMPLPLPPLVEQREIVNRIESLFKIADQIEERYKTAKTNIDKLTQSILAKAFRGELV